MLLLAPQLLFHPLTSRFFYKTLTAPRKRVRDGEVLKSVDVVLYPGAEEVATVEANELPRYCKFVVEGAKQHFRASILVRKDGDGSISALSAE